MPSTTNKLIYSLRIELQDVAPLIWRRIYVPTNVTLHKLHDTIQDAMGWRNSHLHRFKIGTKSYGDRDTYGPEKHWPNEKHIKLDEILGKSMREFRYVYDFGDEWAHRILVESSEKAKPRFPYPMCVAGARACPPEDVGGSIGYQDFLKVILNLNHRSRDKKLLWAGGYFDPEGFDVNAVNERLNNNPHHVWSLRNPK